MSVELGSGRLIPGFEDQLVGAKAGDKRDVKVTFPADYPADNLKGKAGDLRVTVKAVKTAGEAKIDDDFAKSLGLNDLDQLKRPDPRPAAAGTERPHPHPHEAPAARPARRRATISRCRSRWSTPNSRISWRQLRHEASHEADPAAALDEIESDADEYRNIAERRVRLGLLLSEIGAANGIEVTSRK